MIKKESKSKLSNLILDENEKKNLPSEFSISAYAIDIINSDEFIFGEYEEEYKKKSKTVIKNMKDRLIFICWIIEDMRYKDDEYVDIHTNYWETITDEKTKLLDLLYINNGLSLKSGHKIDEIIKGNLH